MKLNELSTQELRAKASALRTEVESLSSLERITPAQDERLSRQLKAFEEVRDELGSRISAVKSQITESVPGFDDVKSPTYWKQTSRAEIFSAETHDVRSKADNAKRAAEVVEQETGLEVRSDVKSHFSKNAGWADVFRCSSDPAYSSGWAKTLAYGEGGAILRMTDEERAAMERMARIQKREMSLTDSEGGFGIPSAVDPSILISGTGAVSSIRSLARVVTAVSDTWRGVSSAGATANFVAEGAEASDNSPTLSSVLIQAHKAVSFLPFTFEVAEDYESLLTQLREMMTDARNTLEADAFLNGDGSGEPYGLLTRLTANSSADLISQTAGTIGAVDIYNLAAELPPRFRPNASWMASMSVLNKIRAISDDHLGNYVTDLRAGYNFSLLGRPVYEASDAPAMVNGTQDESLVVFGDISKAYTIFDRLGSGRVSVVPHLTGVTNGRPLGMSGLYYRFRIGGDSLSGTTSGEMCARVLRNKTS